MGDLSDLSPFISGTGWFNRIEPKCCHRLVIDHLCHLYGHGHAQLSGHDKLSRDCRWLFVIRGKRLIESIYEALSGNLLLTGRVAIKLASNIRQKQPLPAPDQPATLADLDLSEREIEIARYIVAGLTAREISEKPFCRSARSKTTPVTSMPNSASMTAARPCWRCESFWNDRRVGMQGHIPDRVEQSARRGEIG